MDWKEIISLPPPEGLESAFLVTLTVSSALGIMASRSVYVKYKHRMLIIFSLLFLFLIATISTKIVDDYIVITFTDDPSSSKPTLVLPLWACADSHIYHVGGIFRSKATAQDIRHLRMRPQCFIPGLLADLLYTAVSAILTFISMILVGVSLRIVGRAI